MSDASTRITYDFERVLDDYEHSSDVPPIGAQTGLSLQSLKNLEPQLEAARRELFDDVTLMNSGDSIPPVRDPLDAGFIDLPAQLLGPQNEELAKIKRAADRLAAEVDKVVVLGIGGSYMGARAMFEALCHPYHNERSRESRYNRPRIYFEGNNVDNDAVSGLLDLLEDGSDGEGPEASWGIIVISKSGGTLETGVAFRIFLQRLKESCERKGLADRVKDRIVVASSEGSGLWKLAKSLDVPDENLLAFPDNVGGRFSIFSSVGLAPAAVLGVDVDGLLEGARDLTERFREADSLDRVVQDYVGVCHLMEVNRGLTIRVLATWGKRLEGLGLWYDQLLAESLGKDGRGATPLTVVNTRDLHSRGQQHQEGRRDRLITNLIADEPTAQPVHVPHSDSNEDQLNRLAADKPLADILRAAHEATDDAYADDFRRTATVHLPRLDEYCMGQLFQMLMLATVLEGRLIGINPYGQPGVKAYKDNMDRILSKK